MVKEIINAISVIVSSCCTVVTTYIAFKVYKNSKKQDDSEKQERK